MNKKKQRYKEPKETKESEIIEKKLGRYEPQKIEPKWQEAWRESGIYRVDLNKAGKKFYLLVEFTYPSGDLHMGHWFAFAVPDILARKKRMQGYDVFAPNGFDAFGLPAENAAIKRGIHPRDWTYTNIEKMKQQFATMGAIYDWEHEVITCDSLYYKWNQWIFLKMLEKGLAYKGKILSNWCPVDQTVLANENVENGKCWRCGTEVVQKEVEQWFFKITDYADKLLWDENGNGVEWPKSLREGQNKWIGRSQGIEIEFKIMLSQGLKPQNSKFKIKVFTKFPETVFGVTYMVLAPEHPLVAKLTTGGQKKAVEAYIVRASKKTELERTSLEKKKKGVFTGSYCINPVNGQEVPIWVSDYVISTYGTGAVMGVPGSDVRDFEFAKKYDLPIIKVICTKPGDQSPVENASQVLEEGYLINSGQFDNLTTPEGAKEKVMDFLEEKGWGKRKVNYHLHDWSMSRQRYWGTPIPVIYCSKCPEISNLQFPISNINGIPHAIVPVPMDQLPVELPYKLGKPSLRSSSSLDSTAGLDVEYAPQGKPPLATAREWVKVKCPNCGGAARREVETMDTFVDSSWYFLRYLDPKNEKQLTDKKKVSDWMPIDVYFGGAEHTLGHTLYSRFFVKFLQGIGVVPQMSEYAQKRVHHGVILGPDGQRMSKSHGNVVNPDEQVKQYGADAVRMYLAFLGPYDLVAPWDPGGIGGVYNFLQRTWKLADFSGPVSSFPPAYAKASAGRPANNSAALPLEAKRSGVGNPSSAATRKMSEEDLYWMHKTIKKVGEDIENMKFNTAVAAMMEWLNYLSGKAHLSNKASESQRDGGVSRLEYETFLKILAPFAPHITEELWQALENSKLKTQNSKLNAKFDSIHNQSWPEYDEKLAKAKKVTLVVQINGKVRDSLPVEAGIDQKEAEKLALASEKVQRFLEGKSVRKVIFVPDRLVNLVI